MNIWWFLKIGYPMVPLNYPKLEDFNIDIFDISGFRVQHSKNLLFNIYTGLYRYSVYIYIYTSIHNKDHLYGTCLVIIGTMYVYIYIYINHTCFQHMNTFRKWCCIALKCLKTLLKNLTVHWVHSSIYL